MKPWETVTTDSSSWLKLVSSQFKIRGIPQASDIGMHEVQLEVTDGYSSIKEILVMNVTNQPPTIKKGEFFPNYTQVLGRYCNISLPFIF